MVENLILPASLCLGASICAAANVFLLAALAPELRKGLSAISPTPSFMAIPGHPASSVDSNGLFVIRALTLATK